jgi:hypothetical protein
MVTGKGPFLNDFYAFSSVAPDWMTLRHSLNRNTYLKILSESHVGLNLRLNNYEMSATTFPSKVIEYAEHGLLVVSTRTSDVPIIFGKTLIYLEEETTSSLVTLLASLPARRADLSVLAFSGREKVLEICSPISVGLGVSNMIWG